jgi:protein involved in polysaccharide export with SLBB domain
MAGGLRPDAFRVEAAIARSEKDDAQRESGTVTLTTFKVPVPKDFTSLPTEQRTHLKPDDRITIRALPGWERSASVLIEGEVMEPGNYSLLSESDRLSVLIQRAGGLRKEALPEGITVKRKRTIVDMAASGTDAYYDITVNVSAALESPGGIEDIVLKPDDRIFVPTNPGVVEIRGAVNRELTVQHTPGKSLAEYIAMCGGYLDKADPAAVKVFAANKVAITAKARGKGKANLEIPAGSVIEVPFLRETERMLTVEVKGAVEKPAVMQHIEGARLGYYLNLSGGFKDEADIQDISVLLPDGGLLVKSGDQPFNPVIPGGSLVMVSTKPKAGAR